MNKDDQNRDAKGTGTGQPRQGRELEQDRNESLGDRGQGDKTWQPPAGEQGISNRANDEDDDSETDNQGQKTVQGKNQKGPEDKAGRTAGGNQGSKGQNLRDETDQAGKGGQSVGSHKPGGDGPGTKKFKHDHDPAQPKDRQSDAGNENAKRSSRPGSQAEQENKDQAK